MIGKGDWTIQATMARGGARLGPSSTWAGCEYEQGEPGVNRAAVDCLYVPEILNSDRVVAHNDPRECVCRGGYTKAAAPARFRLIFG